MMQVIPEVLPQEPNASDAPGGVVRGAGDGQSHMLHPTAMSEVVVTSANIFQGTTAPVVEGGGDVGDGGPNTDSSNVRKWLRRERATVFYVFVPVPVRVYLYQNVPR